MKMINLIIFFIIFILFSSLACASIERTASSDTTSTSAPGRIIYNTIFYSGIMNYWDGDSYEPIETTLVESSDPLFDYEVTKGVYSAYFKSDPTQGQVVKFVKDGGEVTFQPMALNYRNNLNQLQQINMIQSVEGTPNLNQFIYEDAYGSNLDLKYAYHQEVLKEGLIINSFSDLVAPAQYIIDGGNPTLDLDFVLTTNSNVFINGVEWDKSTTKKTNGDVVISDSNGNILYLLPKPYAYDSANERQQLSYEFKKSSSKLYVIVKTPYSWLQSAVYPVEIDPTVQLQEANTSNLEDVWVQRIDFPNSNFGDYSIFITDSTRDWIIYLKFNLSLPPESTIAESYLHLDNIATDDGTTLDIHHVMNNSWVEGNGTGTDCSVASDCNNGIIWPRQPCGPNFDKADSCNLTVEDQVTTNGVINDFDIFNITNMTIRELANTANGNNFSMAIRDNTGASFQQVTYATKEHATTNLRPYLNITYYLLVDAQLNSPLDGSSTHNKTILFNFSISDVGRLFNYSLYADTNSNPTTQLNYSNNVTALNWTYLYTFFSEIAGSINGTYYWKINGTDNESYSFGSSIYHFDITNNVDTTTNVSIVPTNPGVGSALYSHSNITCGDEYCVVNMTETLWYLNHTPLSTGINISTLGGGNVTYLANITFSARTNDGYGETSWTEWVNSSIVLVGDTTPSILNNCTLQYTSLSSGTNNLTCSATENLSTVAYMRFNLWTPTSNISRSFTFTAAKEVTSTYVIFETSETLIVGSYSVTNVTVEDYSGNIATNHTTYLNFTVTSLPSSSSSGSGGGSSPPEKQIIERNVTIIDKCGNLVCDEGEDPTTCPSDCKLFSFDDIFCWPIPECGNWQRSWFINSVLMLVFGIMLYTNYKTKKVKRL